jgi:hypothetical protein
MSDKMFDMTPLPERDEPAQEAREAALLRSLGFHQPRICVLDTRAAWRISRFQK